MYNTHIPNIDAISGALITLSLSLLIFIFVIRLKLYGNGLWTLKVEIYAEKNPWNKNVQKSTQLLKGSNHLENALGSDFGVSEF